MKQSDVDFSGEPVGIVISRGHEAEKPPRFIAYLWAEAPDEEIVASAKAA